MTDEPSVWGPFTFDLAYLEGRLRELCVWRRNNKLVPEYWKGHVCPDCRRCRPSWLEDDD